MRMISPRVLNVFRQSGSNFNGELEAVKEDINKLKRYCMLRCVFKISRLSGALFRRSSHRHKCVSVIASKEANMDIIAPGNVGYTQIMNIMNLNFCDRPVVVLSLRHCALKKNCWEACLQCNRDVTHRGLQFPLQLGVLVVSITLAVWSKEHKARS